MKKYCFLIIALLFILSCRQTPEPVQEPVPISEPAPEPIPEVTPEKIEITVAGFNINKLQSLTSSAPGIIDALVEIVSRFDIVIIHVETLEDVDEAIDFVKKLGIKLYLAMRPETSVDRVLEYIKEIDGVLVMTADPGHYCEVFLSDTLDKIKKVREIDENIPIEVDGCMDPDNVKLASSAGANIFATGSYIFKSEDVDKALKELQDAIVS